MTSRARGVERTEDGSEVGDGVPIDVGGVCAEGERGSGLGAYPALRSMAGWPEEASEQRRGRHTSTNTGKQDAYQPAMGDWIAGAIGGPGRCEWLAW